MHFLKQDIKASKIAKQPSPAAGPLAVQGKLTGADSVPTGIEVQKFPVMRHQSTRMTPYTTSSVRVTEERKSAVEFPAKVSSGPRQTAPILNSNGQESGMEHCPGQVNLAKIRIPHLLAKSQEAGRETFQHSMGLEAVDARGRQVDARNLPAQKKSDVLPSAGASQVRT
jgi:hypothetical protein